MLDNSYYTIYLLYAVFTWDTLKPGLGGPADSWIRESADPIP